MSPAEPRRPSREVGRARRPGFQEHRNCDFSLNIDRPRAVRPAIAIARGCQAPSEAPPSPRRPGGSPAAYAGRPSVLSTVQAGNPMAPPSMKRVVRLVMLLGTARTATGQACNADGSSATYTETITSSQGVDRRRIQSAGCPNHESYCTGKPANKPTCDEEGLKGSGTEATDQGLDVEVPANPKLLDADAWAAVLADAATIPAGTATEGSTSSLDCEMGGIAYALNGVVFYSGAVGNKNLDPPCPQLDISDATAEWISFDCCSGHSSGTGGYHYHFPPSCLIAQADAADPQPGGHSAQIGWAQDGFPICPRPVSTHAADATRHSPPISTQTARLDPAVSKSATAAPRVPIRPTARTSAAATRASFRASITTSIGITSRAKSTT